MSEEPKEEPVEAIALPAMDPTPAPGPTKILGIPWSLFETIQELPPTTRITRRVE